jgi:hypothetical protein
MTARRRMKRRRRRRRWWGCCWWLRKRSGRGGSEKKMLGCIFLFCCVCFCRRGVKEELQRRRGASEKKILEVGTFSCFCSVINICSGRSFKCSSAGALTQK